VWHTVNLAGKVYFLFFEICNTQDAFACIISLSFFHEILQLQCLIIQLKKHVYNNNDDNNNNNNDYKNKIKIRDVMGGGGENFNKKIFQKSS
jgi:hypothetical protein